MSNSKEDTGTDILTKKLNQVKDVGDYKKRILGKKDPRIQQHKIIPNSVPVKVEDLKENMIIGSTVFKDAQLIIEVDSVLDERKINFLKDKFKVVYIVPEKEEENSEEEKEEQEPAFNIDELVENNEYLSILDLIKKNALNFQDFSYLFSKLKNIEKNDDIDEIFDTVLQYFDLNIRQNILKSIMVYDIERFYNELFKVIIEFEYEEFSENEFICTEFENFFVQKNKTFFHILSKYYEAVSEDRKQFLYDIFKKIDKEKLQKLLFVYTKDPVVKDVAYLILNELRDDFRPKAGVKQNQVDKKTNEISFSLILKEIEDRKKRKDRVLSLISELELKKDGKNNNISKKKGANIVEGDILIQAYYENGNLILPGDVMLTKDEAVYLNKKAKNIDFEVYDLNNIYEFFLVITEKVENVLEKLDMFIYLLEQRDGKTELEVLGIVLNFPDPDYKLAAIKYLIANMSPKRFVYIKAAIKKNIPELSNMLISYFENKNDLFSLKLFLKVVAEDEDNDIKNKTKVIFKKSEKLKDMVRIITRNSDEVLKKLCLKILG